MYKFTNGLVIYDKVLADQLLKQGYKLVAPVKEIKKEEKKELNDNGNKVIGKEYRGSKEILPKSK